MDAMMNREGILVHSNYWKSPDYEQGRSWVFIHDNVWHLLTPLIFPRVTRRAFAFPVTRPSWRKSGRWRWSLEIEGSHAVFVRPTDFIGSVPPPPLPEPGTYDRRHYLCIYSQGLDFKENTCLHHRTALTIQRIKLRRS